MEWFVFRKVGIYKFGDRRIVVRLSFFKIIFSDFICRIYVFFFCVISFCYVKSFSFLEGNIFIRYFIEFKVGIVS